MIPIEFKESNKILTKPVNMTEEECEELPVFSNGNQCISCWRLNLKERLSTLIFGRIWLSILSGDTQPPVWLVAHKTCFANEGD